MYPRTSPPLQTPLHNAQRPLALCNWPPRSLRPPSVSTGIAAPLTRGQATSNQVRVGKAPFVSSCLAHHAVPLPRVFSEHSHSLSLWCKLHSVLGRHRRRLLLPHVIFHQFVAQRLMSSHAFPHGSALDHSCCGSTSAKLPFRTHVCMLQSCRLRNLRLLRQLDARLLRTRPPAAPGDRRRGRSRPVPVTRSGHPLHTQTLAPAGHRGHLIA